MLFHSSNLVNLIFCDFIRSNCIESKYLQKLFLNSSFWFLSNILSHWILRLSSAVCWIYPTTCLYIVLILCFFSFCSASFLDISDSITGILFWCYYYSSFIEPVHSLTLVQWRKQRQHKEKGDLSNLFFWIDICYAFEKL